MFKFLLKSTNEYRFETLDEVKAFQDKLRAEAEEGGWQLNSYNWSEKEIKAQGEVIDTYFVVKAQSVFNTPKNPELEISTVSFS